METQEDEKCMLSWKTDVFKVTNTMKMNLQLDNLNTFHQECETQQFHGPALFRSKALNDAKEIATF